MKTFKDLPAPRGIPLLGNAHQLDKKAIHLSLEKWSREFNHEPYRFQLAKLRFVVLSKPEQVQHVLKNRPTVFRRMREMSKIFDEVGFSSIFTKEGDEWRRQRPMLIPAFTKKSLISFIPQISRKAILLRERLQKKTNGEPIEIQNDFRCFSVDVGCLLVFGIDLKSLENNDNHILHTFHNVVNRMNQRLRSILPYWRVVKMPADRKFDESIEELKQMVIHIARDVQGKMRRNENVGEHCILHTMLEVTDSGENALSDDDLFANMMILVLGSEGTTAAMLSWLCLYLSQDDDLQRRLREEVSGFDMETVDYDALNNLPLTEAVIEETFRIRSTVPALVVEALEDTMIDDLFVEKGTRIFTLTRVDGIKNLENDMVFNPGRWLNDDATPIDLKEMRQKQYPFGYGPRTCPGASLSNLEMKIVLAMLVKHFKLEIVDKDAVEEIYTTSAVPQNLRIRLVALPEGHEHAVPVGSC